MVTAGYDAVCERPAQGTPFGGELVDGMLDKVSGLRVALAQRQVSLLDLVVEAYLPGHDRIITYQSYPLRSLTVQAAIDPAGWHGAGGQGDACLLYTSPSPRD